MKLSSVLDTFDKQILSFLFNICYPSIFAILIFYYFFLSFLLYARAGNLGRSL